MTTRFGMLRTCFALRVAVERAYVFRTMFFQTHSEIHNVGTRQMFTIETEVRNFFGTEKVANRVIKHLLGTQQHG